MIKSLRILLPNLNIDPKTGIEHYATRWQLSRSYRMDDSSTDPAYYDKDAMLVDEVTYRRELEVPDAEGNKYDETPIKRFDYEIEGVTKDTMLYARYQVFLKVPDKNKPGEKKTAKCPWSYVISLRGDQEGFKISDVVIAVPRVFAEEDYNSSRSGSLKLSTSEIDYYMGYGNHTYTKWLIETVDGKKVFEKTIQIEQGGNDNIELPLNMFDPNTAYIIKARHGSHTNWESMDGCKVFLKGLYKDNIYQLQPMSDLIENRKLSLRVILNVLRYKSIDIVIKHKNEIVYSLFGHKGRNPIIEIKSLKLNQPYELHSRVEYETGKYTPWRHDTNLISKPNIPHNINKNVKYAKNFSFVSPFIQYGSKSIYAKELLSGGFVIPHSGQDSNTYRGLSYYMVENDQLNFIKHIEDDSSISQNDIDSGLHTTVVPLYNGDFLVNKTTTTVDNHANGSVWIKYSVNPTTLKFTKLGEVARVKELGGLSLSGGVAVMPNNDVYYVPSKEIAQVNLKSASLYKLDTETMKVTKVCPLPFEAKLGVSVVAYDNNTILVAGGSNSLETETTVRTNHDIYTYNITSGEFVKLPVSMLDIVPDTIYNQHMIVRMDGKVVFFNNTDDTIGENQQTYLLDIEAGTLVAEENDFPDNRPYTKTLILNNGQVYRISTGDVQPEQIFSYHLATQTIHAIGDEVVNDYIDVLTIGDGDMVVTENIRKYASIVIQGTGKLVWIDGEKTLTFDSSTKLILNTTKFTLTDMHMLGDDEGVMKHDVLLIEPDYLIFEDSRDVVTK